MVRLGRLRYAGLILLGACADPGSGTDPEMVAGMTMGTQYHIKFWFPEPRGEVTRGFLETEIEIVLADEERLFSTYLEHSEISQFNAHRSKEPLRMSPEFFPVLVAALDLAAKTDGAYDPTVMPLVRLQGFGPEQRGEVDAAAVAAAREHIGYRKVMILGEYLEKRDIDVELDLSSIAKGHAVDRVIERLQKIGIEHCMVEIGGEVSCIGGKATGDPWRIGIEVPIASADGQYQQQVEVYTGALATSGDYRNRRDTGSGSIHHIFDPRSGENADNRVLSVSVRANSCMIADGLATALMVLGPDGAAELCDAYPEQGLQVLFLLEGETGSVVEHGIRWR